MDLLNDLNVALLTALVLVVAAGMVLVVWNFHRSHQELLWMSAGHFLAALSWGFFSALKPQDAQHVALWLSALYLSAHAALAQALAQRVGRRVDVAWTMLCAALALLGVLYWNFISDNSKAQWVTSSVGAGLLLAQVLAPVWRASKRHRAESALWAAYAFGSLFLLLQPAVWLLDRSQATWGWMIWASPAFAVAFAVLATVAMLTAVVADRQAAAHVPADLDSLTGLLHRAAFEQACGVRPYERRIRVLALCDIDHFHRIDQEQGTEVAHEVLRNFAKILQSNVREGDSVAYLGGEAFALALRHIDAANARALMQRIAHRLREQHWAEHAPFGPITASVGLAVVRESDSLSIAMHRADVLLYQAKESGRNRIWVDEIANEEDALG